MVPSKHFAQKRSVLHVYSHSGIGILCTETPYSCTGSDATEGWLEMRFFRKACDCDLELEDSLSNCGSYAAGADEDDAASGSVFLAGLRMLPVSCQTCGVNWPPAEGQTYEDSAEHLKRKYKSDITGNQLNTLRQHMQPVVQAATAQATSYTGSDSTGNQLYRQRMHRQPVIQAAKA